MVAESKFMIDFFYISGEAEINQSGLFFLRDISNGISGLQLKLGVVR